MWRKMVESKLNMISPFFHEYDFPYHDQLLKFIPALFENWEIQIDKIVEKGGYNSVIMDRNFQTTFRNMIWPIIQPEYNLSPPTTPQIGAWCYIQNNKRNYSVWHRHLFKGHMPALVCSTYLNIPEKGGEFEFITNDPATPMRVKPKKDKLYVFPSWLLHRPLPQEDEDWRYCLTYQYVSDKRISHPNSDILW